MSLARMRGMQLLIAGFFLSAAVVSAQGTNPLASYIAVSEPVVALTHVELRVGAGAVNESDVLQHHHGRIFLDVGSQG